MSIATDGRCARLGTVTLIQLATRKLLMTADHVAAGIAEHGGTIRVGLASSSSAPMPIDLQHAPDIIWRSAALDVALLSCPQELVDSPNAKWFDLAVHAAMTSKLRTARLEHDTAGTSLPYFVIGLPNFSRVTLDAQRLEVFGVVSLPAYITQFESHPWSGERDKAPQIHLELDVDQPNPALKPEDPLGAMMFKQAATTSFDTGLELGGISGGPVILVDGAGEFLLGIVKQGSTIFGNKLVLATAIDDVMATPGFPVTAA